MPDSILARFFIHNTRFAVQGEHSFPPFLKLITMKKMLMMLTAAAFVSSAAIAQDVPKTEVKVRDNGTVKATTKTGKTNVGAALDNTKDAAGNVIHRAGHAIKRGAKKTSHAVRRGADKTSSAMKRGTAKAEAKTE